MCIADVSLAGWNGAVEMNNSADSMKILTVEDDNDFARMLKLILNRHFSSGVVIAGDCSSAREAFLNDDFNLITLDYQLPDGSGLELLKEIAAINEHPPVIMVTGQGDEETAAQAIEHGVDGYVVKDNRLATLFPATIKRIFEKEEAKKAMRFSDEKYDRLFDNMLEGFAYCEMIYDDNNRPMDWIYLETNKALEVLSGLTDVVGKKISDVVPDLRETNPGIFEIYGRVALSGTPEQFEIRVEPLSVDLLVKAFSPARGYFVAVFENITERKEAERKLQHQYLTLERIIESADSPIYSIDTGYCYTSFNKAHADAIKAIYGAEIKIGDNILNHITTDEDRIASKQRLDRALSGEVFFEGAFAGDKRVYWRYFDRWYNPVCDEIGNVVGAAIVAHDVTDLKESEEMLADSLERLEAAQEAAELGFWKLDIAEMGLEWTNGVKRIFELGPGSPSPTYEEFWDFVHPEDREFVMAQAEKQFKPLKEPLKYDYRIITNAGNVKYLEHKVKQSFDDSGNVIKLSGSVQDVTDRKNEEVMNEERWRQLSGIFDNFRDVMFYLSVEPGGRYRFLSVNNAFLEVTGISMEDVVGKYVDEVIPEPLLSKILDFYKRAVDNRETVRWEETAYYPEGRTYGDFSITPIFDSNGRSVNLVGSIHDVTDLKETEKELQRLNTELTGYAHALSHYLKGPLSSAHMAFDMLLDALKEGRFPEEKCDELNEIISIGLRKTGKANALVDELLYLAQTGEPKDVGRVNIEEEINEVLSENADIINNRGVIVEIGSPLGEVVASRTQIYRLFANLIGNSMRHSRADSPIIRVSNLGSDGAIHRFQVWDNGAGIPENILDKVFTPFVKENSDGTGIGLSIVEKIIKANGGEIKAYNNNGACFEFTLIDRSL